MKIEGEPATDAPISWSDYPNGLDPAPIAATTDASTVTVARVRPSAPKFGSPRVLELGAIDPTSSAFQPFGVVPTQGSPIDVAIASDGAAGVVIAYTDSGGGWSERLSVPDEMSLDTRTYYDEFAAAYEAQRRPNDPHGYHALVDDLEIDIVETLRRAPRRARVRLRHGPPPRAHRALRRSRQGHRPLARHAREGARARPRRPRGERHVASRSPTTTFDVACSFKVLAHVEDIGRALSEMARVTRPGGVVIAEFYNPLSFRGLAKRLGPAGKVSNRTRESAVFTRFDAPWVIGRIVPEGTRIEARYGVRIVTPGGDGHARPRAPSHLAAPRATPRPDAGRVPRRASTSSFSEKPEFQPNPRSGASVASFSQSRPS